jgi:WD40 repeat protein
VLTSGVAVRGRVSAGHPVVHERGLTDPHHPTALDTLNATDDAQSVALSPDGHTLATTSADHTARLWETNVDRVTARICSITPTITKNDWDHYLPSLPYHPPCP